MNKFKVLIILLLSIVCVVGGFAETNYVNIDYKHPQNIEYPIVSIIPIYETLELKDTTTLKEFFDSNESFHHYKIFNGDKVEVTKYECRKIKEEERILFNNPIELGLYNRDKAKVSFIVGSGFIGTGILMSVSSAICHSYGLHLEGKVIDYFSIVPYAAGTGGFIAGAVFQTRANHCLLVGCSNYGINAAYKF